GREHLPGGRRHARPGDDPRRLRGTGRATGAYPPRTYDAVRAGRPGRGGVVPPRRRDMDRELVRKLLDDAGASRNRDVLGDILRNAYGLATDDADRLDLKIPRDSLREMREAFRLFAPYDDVRKVTVFGSVRTLRTDPLYEHA